MKRHLSITVIIPVLNEKTYIRQCIGSIVEGLRYGGFLEDSEIIVADGRSTDGTRNQIELMTDEIPVKLVVLDNPLGTTPAGLNLALGMSSGKYIIRIDAHAVYPVDYISNLVRALKEADPKVCCVGGSIETKVMTNSFFGQLAVAALSSRAGVGNSSFRTSRVSVDTSVDTVPFGAFKKDCLVALGGFSEEDPRNEDIELCYRIRSAGFLIKSIPSVSCTYYARDRVGTFFKHAFDNGSKVTEHLGRSIKFLSLRHFAPLVFVLSMVSLMILSAAVQTEVFLALFCGLMAVYFFFIFITSVDDDLDLNVKLALPWFCFLFHVSYGIGSVWGLVRWVISLLYPRS